ncbi:hypothetical protein R1flu_026179 [Riccia fluitans]|uniref:Leucine-rich repeat-containing N-terminal plant-type domain-containing protein n=1 Tax=Riccia fluitans TaxID=41844 RepID=A0ABD1XI64_9MARC
MKVSSSPMVVARSKFLQIALGVLQLGFMVAAIASLSIANSARGLSSDLQCAVSGTTPFDGMAFDEQISFQLKSGLSDPGDVLGNWDQKFSSVCNWTGVTSDGQSNRVSELRLPPLGVKAPLTAALGFLEVSKTTNIVENSFYSGIPSKLFRKDCSLNFARFGLNNLSHLQPDTVGNCPATSVPKVNGNSLGGIVLEALTNLTSLSVLDLSSNQFVGQIPHILSHPEGSVPSWLLNLGKLELSRLNLGHNKLDGKIPRSLGSCKSLIDLSLTNNKLKSSIIADVGDLTSFQKTLNLSHNLLQSSIPASLGFLSSVQQIYLSANILAGNIPPSLDSFTYQLYVSNDGSRPLPGDHEAEKAITNREKTLIVAGAAGAAFFIALILVYHGRPWIKKSHDAQVQELASWDSPDLEIIRLTVEDPLRATANFSRESIRGFGSSGNVHKGVLQSFPFVIAVKKFSDDEEGRKRLSREARIRNYYK